MSENFEAAPAPQPPAPQYAASAPLKKGFAVTALVLGIVALVGSWLPFLNVGSMIIAVVGLVFGVIAIVKAIKGTAAGKVMAIVGTVLSVLAIIFAMVINAATVSAVDDAFEELEGSSSLSTTSADPASDAEEPAADDATEEEPAEADEPALGSFESPAALGDGNVWAIEQGGDAWDVTLESVEIVPAWAGEGDVAIVFGTATPTAISDGAMSNWATFPMVGWISGGAAIDDTFSMADMGAYPDYRSTVDLEAAEGTEMKFYSSVGLPDGVSPELITLDTMFGSDPIYIAVS